MAGIDINRTTAGVQLPRPVANEIWANVLEASTVMQAANTIPLPGAGLTIPMITGEPVAAWVAETNEKPVSRHTVSSKTMTGYTISVIEPFSNQFKRDLPGLYRQLVQRLPAALSRRFDETVYGVTAVPGSGFDTLGGAPTLTLPASPTLPQVLAVVTAVAAAGGDVSDWIVTNPLYASLLGSINAATGQQYFTLGQRPDGALAPTIFGAPVRKTKAAFRTSTTVGDDTGIAGDFAGSAYVGTVEGVSISVSDQATINDGGTQLNLWQRNMFAVRAEIELGFIVRDVNHFVRLTDGTVDNP
jgi:HK97 family phage major capsid protein